jgi:hypothetical protein
MTVVKFRKVNTHNRECDVTHISASAARLRNEITLITSLITNSNLGDKDKLLIISDLMRVSGLVLGIQARHALALAEKRIRQDLAPNICAESDHEQHPVSHSDGTIEGSEHGN